MTPLPAVTLVLCFSGTPGVTGGETTVASKWGFALLG